MRPQAFNRNTLALPALVLLAAACSSSPATHPPAAMQQGCAFNAAGYPPCEPRPLFYPGGYYFYGYLYPGLVLVPVLVTPPVPPVPVVPHPTPKPKPAPAPKLHPRQHPGIVREPCKVVNGHRVCL
jgi:hypothetical protein